MDYIALGAVPYNEKHVTDEDPHYYSKALMECLRYKPMLYRIFPVPLNVDAYFETMRLENDDGTHFEVCVVYDETSTEAFKFACSVDISKPAHWSNSIIQKGTMV